MIAVARKTVLLPALLIVMLTMAIGSGVLAGMPFLHWGKADVFDAHTGYRIASFRAELPSAVSGGSLVDIDALEAMIAQDKPLLIDVVSAETSLSEWFRDWLRGHPPERKQIAGSIWLPRLGEGKLSQQEAGDQKRQLLILTTGSLDQPMVFYCLSNCWVSWNAARRAVSFGFRKVFWYRDGIEVWLDAGLPVQDAPHSPIKLPQHTMPSRASTK